MRRQLSICWVGTTTPRAMPYVGRLERALKDGNRMVLSCNVAEGFGPTVTGVSTDKSEDGYHLDP